MARGTGTCRAQAYATVGAVATWMLLAGCSSSSSPPPPPPVPVTCPAHVADAIGAPCGKEGMICEIGFPCGSFNQQAECTCTGGTFACTDQVQGAIPDGGAPRCGSNGHGNDSQCPATEDLADTFPCKTAGLLCFYSGVQCPKQPEPFTDSCQCVGDQMGGLAYVCDRGFCNPAPDAGPSPLPEAGPEKDTGAQEGGD